MADSQSQLVELSDDPASWHRVVKALAQRIHATPVHSLDEAAATLDVLGVLEQVRAWCGQRAGMVDDA